MRLTPKELEVIIASAKNVTNGTSAELRLYGSRIDDSLKGGDIDLILIVQEEKNKQKLLNMKLDMLVEIKMAIDEQKIDLSVVNKDSISKDSFLTHAYETSILLETW